jgi:hypothetical protein
MTERVEEVNGNIVITRTSIINKIYLGTVEYNKYYDGKYEMYYEKILVQVLNINCDYLLFQEEIEHVFKEKLTSDYYKYSEAIYNKHYIYMKDGTKIEYETLLKML